MFEKGYIAKRDIVVIVLLLAVSFAFFAFWAFRHSRSGGRIRIEQRGALLGVYDLDKDQVILIRDSNGNVINQVTIEGGQAHMSEANCRDQLCVKQGRINKVGQSIVCLPNRVVITVISGDKNSMDSVVK